MPPKKPSQNKRGAARREQQPSLLEQLEFYEERPHENDRDSDRGSNRGGDRENALSGEDPGNEGGSHDSGATTPEPANSHPAAARGPYERAPEPLQKAYARYAEIVGATYSSTFSDAKRRAAFKEAAKAHGVRMAALKRYSTSAALGIPYHHNADSEAEPAPLDPETG